MDAESATSTKPTTTKSDVGSQHGGEDHGNVGERAERAVGTGESFEAVGSTMVTDTSREKLEKGEENHEYITGFKLLAVLGSVTLTAFLILLDGSIVGVVSWHTQAYTEWVVGISLEKKTDRVAL